MKKPHTMKTEDFFKEKKNTIGWVSQIFRGTFYGMDMTIPNECRLSSKILERSMTDKQIMAKWKPEECTLGEVAYALTHDNILLKNGYANIFYVRDKNNVLWAVDCRWDSGGQYWDIFANSVGGPSGWSEGARFVSRVFNLEGYDTSDSLKLGRSDEVKITEIEFEGKRYKLVQE